MYPYILRSCQSKSAYVFIDTGPCSYKCDAYATPWNLLGWTLVARYSIVWRLPVAEDMARAASI